MSKPNSFPPYKSLYLTVLPPPLITPLLAVRPDTGTPSFADAASNSSFIAVRAAARHTVERCEIPLLPPPPPTEFSHDSGWAYTIIDMSVMFSSSAESIRIPVGVPANSTWPCVTTTLFSGVIAIHMST